MSRITAGGVIGEAAALACLLQVEWGTDLAAAQSPPDADEGQDMGVSSPVRFGRPLAADEVRRRSTFATVNAVAAFPARTTHYPAQ